MADNVKILDGGFSTQLSTHVGDKIDGEPLWTASFLASNPQAIVDTHLDFLRAGSDIIESNTYQASVPGFMKYMKLSEEESIQLIKKGAKLAKSAVKIYKQEMESTKVANPNPLVAGSCGPYGAALHDCSEYTGIYGNTTTKEVLAEFHRPRMRALVEEGVDLLALETIPCLKEAEVLVDLLKEFPGTKAWLSFSCLGDGRSIVDGNDFKESVKRCYDKAPGQIIAVGVNCLASKYVTPLIAGLNEKSKDFIPLVVYSNSGDKYSIAEGWTKDVESAPLEDVIREWLDMGVRYVGGCCRTYAKDIVNVRSIVESWTASRASYAN